MTGSGKTGLVTVLVEEILRARVPVLMIDVKGDQPNLKLALRPLSADALAPWVEPAPNDADGVADNRADEAGARVWSRLRARDAESDGPRLSGPRQRRPLVPRPPHHRRRSRASRRGARRRPRRPTRRARQRAPRPRAALASPPQAHLRLAPRPRAQRCASAHSRARRSGRPTQKRRSTASMTLTRNCAGSRPKRGASVSQQEK